MCEVNVDIKNPPFINASFWPWDGSLPLEEVVTGRTKGYATQVLLLQIGNLALDAFERSLAKY